MYIPEDIVRAIVGFADVPIDTRRAFGVYKKVNVDDKLVDSLAAVNESKYTLINTKDTTVYQTRCSKGCKLQTFTLKVNRLTTHDQYVLVKGGLKVDCVLVFNGDFAFNASFQVCYDLKRVIFDSLRDHRNPVRPWAFLRVTVCPLMITQGVPRLFRNTFLRWPNMVMMLPGHLPPLLTPSTASTASV